jgi:hypothetical protein
MRREQTKNDTDLGLLRSIIGNETLFQEIIATFEGSSVYFPRIDRHERARRILSTYQAMRERQILSKAAVELIAKQESVSSRYVYKLIMKSRKVES